MIVGWLLVSSAAGVYQPKVTESVTSDTRLFLPDGTESSRVDELARAHFTDLADSDLVAVYHREDGLTDADHAVIDGQRGQFANVSGVVQMDDAGQRSADGTTAFLTVRITDRDADEVDETVAGVRSVAQETDGLTVEVTGAPAVTSDARELFASMDLPLLLGTASLVLVILLFVYRSPLLALVPLAVVTVAYTVAAGLVYGLIQAGLTVDGQSASLLVILMFGAGTDYCLVLVARYREELASGLDERAAMARTICRTAPTIAASAVTVMVGLLCLVLASLGSFRALGPVGAVGIAVVFVASLTLLPALILLIGAKRLGLLKQAARGPRRAPLVVTRALRTPRRTAAATVTFLLIGSAGMLGWQDDSNIFGGFRQETESQRGSDLLRESFSPGELAPLTAIAVTGSSEEAAAEREVIQADPDVSAVSQPEASDDGAVHRMRVVLDVDPYSHEALDTVERLRASLATTYLGGTAGVQVDLRSTAAQDLMLIIPLVLIAVGTVVALLLRAIVAAALALATVVVSFAATLGLAYVLLTQVLGQDGIVPTIPLLAFVFLVSLGVDYTIFLLARVREAAHHQPVPQAVRTAMDTTWSVITSAGLVLAGTFMVLAAFPVDLMLQVGFIVALGVLLDTFIVRGILLPAVATMLGSRLWWPRRAEPVGEELAEARSGA